MNASPYFARRKGRKRKRPADEEARPVPSPFFSDRALLRAREKNHDRFTEAPPRSPLNLLEELLCRCPGFQPLIATSQLTPHVPRADDDPWQLLVSVVLLNKSTRCQVEQVIWKLFEKCKCWDAVEGHRLARVEARSPQLTPLAPGTQTRLRKSWLQKETTRTWKRSCIPLDCTDDVREGSSSSRKVGLKTSGRASPVRSCPTDVRARRSRARTPLRAWGGAQR